MSIDSIYRNTSWATDMLALNVGVSVALQDILTRKDRSYSLTMWGVVTMNRVVATIIPSDYFKDNPDANCNDDWRYKTPIK